MRRSHISVLIITLCVLYVPAVGSWPLMPTDMQQPQSNCRFFSETGHQACGIFLTYWNEHGGLAQQGLPITEPMSELSDTDGKTYMVQYFERAVFEYHPENTGNQYEVLLSLLGNFFHKQKYPGGARGQQPNTQPGSVLFRETGKRLGGRFLDYWRTHGGLPQQGYPISDEFVERSDLDGKEYRVQYFERAVFELHPENAPPNDVLLSQLGTYRHIAKNGGKDGDSWTALRARPLDLPELRPGETCPASRGKTVAPHIAEAFGDGPVYPVLGAQGVAEISLAGAPKEGDWYLLKTLWVAPPDYNGPVLIRGKQLDGEGELRFGAGMNPAVSLELNTPRSGLPAVRNNTWREWPNYTRLRSSGCYAYRVDGLRFRSVVVVKVGN